MPLLFMFCLIRLGPLTLGCIDISFYDGFYILAICIYFILFILIWHESVVVCVG